MPAYIGITNVTPYSNAQYQSFQSSLNCAPAEGSRVIPVSFAWLTDGIAPNYAVEVNLANQPQLQISQICSMLVDNTQSDADCFFYFPDTQCRVTVPQGTEALIPVSTNGVRFIAYSPNAVDGDATWVQSFNYYPPPLALEKTQYTSPESATAAAVTTAATHENIYTGPGSIRALSIYLNDLTASVTSAVAFSLTDDTGSGTGALLWYGVVGAGSTTIIGIQQLAQMTGIDIPFTNGVTFNINTASNADVTDGQASANVYVSHK